MKHSIRSIFSYPFQLCLFSCLLWNTVVSGQEFSSLPLLSENATVSLVTVYPRDKAIYAIFGHTALRVQDPDRHIDLVYNYGYFDSSQPNFIYHFVKGETDYVLGIDLYDSFIYNYARDNSHVIEQVLNLSAEEKEAVFKYLNTNALPENREYRYNYFFDNCTTRPRDIIENHLAGSIIYPEQEKPTTFRNLVHDCTRPYPWLSFGIDLVLGYGADSTIHVRNELFLPLKLMQAFDRAKVETASGNYPLVKATHTLLLPSEESSAKKTNSFFSPLTTSVFLLILVVCLTILGDAKKRMFRGIDFMLFLSAGIAGCIVWFISFISTHPCTSGNIHAIWLHPVHLIAAFFFLLNIGKKITYWYHLINFALLLVLLCAWCFIPQQIPIAAIPLVLCLWLRSGYQVINLDKRATKKE